MEDLVLEAHRKAIAVRLNAYAPYSKYKVGAVIKFKGVDELFVGCNVENSSYGATVCAERNAVFSGIGRCESRQIEFLVLVTDNIEGVPPCAMCLQVLSEFCKASTPIYIANLEKILKKLNFSDLLPMQFDKQFLPTESD